MNDHTLLAFIIVSLSQTFSVGPGVALVIKRAIEHGTLSALKTSCYIRTGEFLVIILTLMMLLLTGGIQSYLLYLKILGGIFLVYIGISGILKKGNRKTRAFPVLIPLSNPKAFLFFAGFIPSFIHKDIDFNLAFIGLGLLFILLSFFSDIVYVIIVSTLKKHMNATVISFINTISSLLIIVTGIYFILTVFIGATH